MLGLVFVFGVCGARVHAGGTVQSGNMAPIASGAKTDGGKPLDLNSGPANAQIINDPNFDECGQDCLYGKANENISLQYQYNSKKLEFLNSEVAAGSSNSSQADEYERRVQALDDQKREVLGSFCIKDPEPESLSDCIARYKMTSDLWVAKVRFALAKNEESHGKMASRQDGLRTMQKTKVEGTGPKQSQMPFFSQSSDLGSFKPSTDPSALKERGTLDMLEPVASEYVLFDQIPRDPSDPSKGFFTVPKVKNGKHVLDDKAYKAALAIWKGGGVMEGVVAKFREKNQKLADQIKADQLRFSKEFSKGVAPEQRSIARKIYDDARGGYINEVNGGGKKAVPQTMGGNTPQERVQNNYAPSQTFSGPQGQAQGQGPGLSAQQGQPGQQSPGSTYRTPAAGPVNYIPGQYSGEEQVKQQQGTQVYVRNVADQLSMHNIELLTPEQQAQLAKDAKLREAQLQNSTVSAPGAGGPSPASAPPGNYPPGTTVVPQSPYSGNSMPMDQLLNP